MPNAGRLVGSLALASAAGSVLAGCTTHQCDPNTVVAGPDSAPPPVLLPDGEYEWATSRIDQDWVPFTAGETYVLRYPVVFDPAPWPECALSSNGVDAAETNFVLAGTAVQFTAVTGRGATIINPACAEYSIRCTVRGFTVSAADGGLDGEADDATSE